MPTEALRECFADVTESVVAQVIHEDTSEAPAEREEHRRPPGIA